jgi:DNA-binding transcriptional ArsR family regulator
MKILANENRLMILCQLVDGEKSVGELVELLDLSDGVIPAKAMYVSTVNGYSARSKLDKNGALPVISKFGSLENTNEKSVVTEAIKKAQTEEQFSAQQTMSFNGIPTGDFNGDGCNDNVTLNSSSIVISTLHITSQEVTQLMAFTILMEKLDLKLAS